MNEHLVNSLDNAIDNVLEARNAIVELENYIKQLEDANADQAYQIMDLEEELSYLQEPQ